MNQGSPLSPPRAIADGVLAIVLSGDNFGSPARVAAFARGLGHSSDRRGRRLGGNGSGRGRGSWCRTLAIRPSVAVKTSATLSGRSVVTAVATWRPPIATAIGRVVDVDVLRRQLSSAAC